MQNQLYFTVQQRQITDTNSHPAMSSECVTAATEYNYFLKFVKVDDSLHLNYIVNCPYCLMY